MANDIGIQKGGLTAIVDETQVRAASERLQVLTRNSGIADPKSAYMYGLRLLANEGVEHPVLIALARQYGGGHDGQYGIESFVIENPEGFSSVDVRTGQVTAQKF